MNRTFKTIFSKARGAMVVTSEAATSTHKKGTKTLVAAAAAALVMGSVSAQAADWVNAPEAGEDGQAPAGVNFVTKPVASIEGLQSDKFNQYVYTQNAGTTGFASASEGKVVFGEKLWVTGSGEKTQSHGFHASGEGVQITNQGEIYVQAGEGANSWSQKGMMAGNGATVVNEGTIVAKNAYGMTVQNKNATAGHIVNKGTITVLEQGAGIELGGADESTAVNNGTITVGDIAETSWGHGVLIKDSSNNVFTNRGTIEAAENGTAIDVQVSNGETTAGNILNLEAGSKIVGEVHIQEGVTGTVLNANGFQGELDLNNKSNELTINVDKGADLALKDGYGSTISKVEINNGKLSASIWQSYESENGTELKDNIFKDVTVNEGGIFNVTKLNSVWNDPATGEDEAEVEGAEKNQFLIKGATYTLNGGKLYAEDSEWHGNVKVGTYGGAESGLTLENGDYHYTNMTVGTSSALTVTDGANVTLDSLLVYKAKDGKTASVNLTNSASLTVDDITFEDDTGTFTLNGGTLNTTADSLLTTEGVKHNFTLASGTIGIDGALDISKAELLANQNVTVVADEIVAMVGGQAVEITTIKNEDLSTNVAEVDAAAGVVYGGATLQATDVHNADSSAIHINTGLAGVQKIEILNKDVTHLDLDSNFQLIGDGSDLVVGSNENSQFRIEGQILTLGTTADQAKGGKYLGRIMGNGTVKVAGGNFVLNDADVGTFNVDDVARVDMTSLKTASGQVDGTLMTKTLVKDSKVTVSGTFGVQTIEEGATVNTNVDNSGDFFIAEAAVDKDGKRVAQIQGKLTAGSDSYLTTNLSAEADRRLDAALASLGDEFDDETAAVAYVDHTIDVGDKGAIYFGEIQSSTGENSVRLATNSVVVVDAGKFISTGDMVFGADVTLGSDNQGNHATVVLDNLLSKGTIQFGESVNPGTGFYKDTNLFLEVSEVAEGKLTVDFNRDAVQDTVLEGALDQILSAGGNRQNQEVINAIGQQDEFLNTHRNQLNSRGERAAKEYLAAPVTAGTYNMAYDSAELISNAIIQHNLQAKQGLGVWADVFYGSNETDDLYGSSGYSSDIYGGMLGVDYGFGEGARIGAALSIGSGDGDSEGSVSKYSTDTDFWGLSLYAGKDIGGLTFTADMSYLWLDNDIGGTVAGASASESIDSTVFSIGGRADWKAYEGDVMQVVPHVGIRWASIDVDDYRGLSMDDMNVIEMPVGVTVKGVFETASGWTVAPAVDFTAAPQIGDTDVETIVGDVDVIDNVYNASIGVSAGNDAMRFGLSYKYGFGNDGRSNNTFNLKASYLF